MTTVLIGEAPRGRVTGWAVACSQHGAMPVLCPSRGQARGAAVTHLRTEHGGEGQVLESKRPIRAAKAGRAA